MQLIDVIATKGEKAPSKAAETNPAFVQAEEALDELEAALASSKNLKHALAEPIVKQLFKTFVELRAKAFETEARLSERLAAAETFSTRTRDGQEIKLSDPSLGGMQPARSVELSDLRKAADVLGYLIVPIHLADPGIYLGVLDDVLGFWERSLEHGHEVYLLGPAATYNPVHQLRLFSGNTYTSKGCINSAYDFYGKMANKPAETRSRADWILRQYGREHADDRRYLMELMLGSYARPEIRCALNLVISAFGYVGADGPHHDLDPELLRIGQTVYVGYLTATGLAKTEAEAFAKLRLAPLWKQRHEQERRNKEREAEERRRMEAARRLDPIMFAVPAHVNLQQDKFAAILGPCWGPDLPREMLALMAPFFNFKQK